MITFRKLYIFMFYMVVCLLDAGAAGKTLACRRQKIFRHKFGKFGKFGKKKHEKRAISGNFFFFPYEKKAFLTCITEELYIYVIGLQKTLVLQNIMNSSALACKILLRFRICMHDV